MFYVNRMKMEMVLRHFKRVIKICTKKNKNMKIVKNYKMQWNKEEEQDQQQQHQQQ